MQRAFIILLFLFLVACSPQLPANTGIEGQVLIGPTCPVVQQGKECPDKPYQAALTVLDSSGTRKIARFQTDTEGRFRLPLAPGNYILHPETPENMPMPIAPEQNFTVTDGQFTQISVAYDSGIR
jgi:hypothetical protein